VKDSPRFFSIQRTTRSVSAITSGPIPSPASTKILYVTKNPQLEKN